ncbi:unnamed protein product [Allacma fusca]|uniref:Uncharacterized protein n=1 Tax=Allacma fusca TaxID=39272 RepID=A0A8J2NVP0_9HEXA|nr:unnamed protein product [Allacma fusca]
MGREKHKDSHKKKKKASEKSRNSEDSERTREKDTSERSRKSKETPKKTKQKNPTEAKSKALETPESTSHPKKSTSRSSSSSSSNSSSSSSSSSNSNSSGINRSETGKDVKPKRKVSDASSLRSKTFDLREFTGMEPDPVSSSPSMADTIIARGVEYKGTNNARYAQANTKQSRTSDAPSRSKSENFLQPEEFLNVDAKRFVKRPAGRMQRQSERLIMDPFDEDKINVVNYRTPHGRHSPNYSMRMDQKFSPINYFDPNQSGNSLRSTFESEEQFRSWKENAPNSMPDIQPYRNGWHQPTRQPIVERQKLEKIPLTFWEVLEGSIFGSAPLIQEFLKERQALWYWWPCIFLECFFRSVSAVSLAPNPFSGFIIFLSMQITTPIPTLIGSLALVTGILSAIFLVEIPTETVRGGGVAFNAFLMGVIMGELSDVTRWSLYITVIVASIVIIFIYCGMQGVVRNTNLPILNAPFNIAAFIYFTCGLAALLKGNDTSSNLQGVDVRNASAFSAGNITRLFGQQEAATEATTTIRTEDFDWVKVFRGIVISPSQFYLTDTVVSSVFVFIAWFIFSPTLALQALLGAVVGSLVGIVLDEPPYTNLYNGGWCYNSLFTCISLGGVFYLLNLKSWILSVVGAMLTALVFGAFLKAEIQILGIPFMLVTWLFLAMSHVDEHKKMQTHGQNMYRWFAFFRIPNDKIQTPEAHLHWYCKNQYKPGRVGPNGEKNGVPAELHL